MSNPTFVAWRRPAIALSGTPEGGRLRAVVRLRASSRTDVDFRNIPVLLPGPGDVQALAATAVTARVPSPGTVGAETTKCAYVELQPPDLPWRYSPRGVEGGALRPWIVLVVGSPVQIVPTGQRSVRLAAAVTAAHDLGASGRTAHIQALDGREVARVVCERMLEPHTSYVAALVAAFTDDGAPSWSPGQEVEVACFDRWTFQTGEPTDFYDLATALEAAAAAAFPGLGVADVAYRDLAVLPTGGALTRPSPATPVPDPVRDDLRARTDVDGVDSAGRSLLGLPRYDAPWGDPGGAVTQGWRAELADDPRARVSAGLGALCATAAQETIVEAARKRAGVVRVAAGRVGGLALGIAAGGSLVDRKLPADPARRLALLGPGLAGVPTDDGRSVLDRLTGAVRLSEPEAGVRPASAAAFSSAAVRLLRPGTARGRGVAPGAMDPGALVRATSSCPEPDAPAGAGSTPDVDRLVVGVLGAGAAPTLAAEPAAVWEALQNRDFFPSVPPIPGPKEGRTVPCVPAPLDAVSGALGPAYDPRDRSSPATTLVVDGLDGVVDTKPVGVCFDLDLPAWQLLRDHARDWLLPGAGALPTNRVTQVVTNPAFVDAFMVGLNAAGVGELRWRNLPMISGCTPLQRFWQMPDLDDDGRLADVVEIGLWTDADGLGAASHRPPGAPATATVVLARTELFRRYPETLLYLYPGDPPAWPHPSIAADPSRRVFPTFTGEVEPGLAFFGFPCTPQQARTHWLVLEQIPRGFQFWSRHPDDDTRPLVELADAAHGADFAAKALARPLRVLFRGEQLLADEVHA